MKQIVLYKCEICGHEYKSQSDAEGCESFHVVPDKSCSISFEGYQPYFEQDADYLPRKIVIELKNGEKRVYKR